MSFFPSFQNDQNPTRSFSPLFFPVSRDGMNMHQDDIGSIHLLQSNNNTVVPSLTNSTSWTDPIKYSLSVVMTSGPFFFIFWILLVVSIIVYALKRKDMKRNQHILFVLTIVLALDVTANLTLRIISELGNFTSVGSDKSFSLYYTIMGAVQRVSINYWVWHQLLMMAFLCHVFAKTCKETGAISQTQFTRMKIAIQSTLIGSAIFFAIQTLAVVVLGALVSAGIIREASSILAQQVAIFLAACVMFFVFTICFSILLNVTGYKLNSSLQESVKKLKAKMKKDHSHLGVERANGDSSSASSMGVTASNSQPSRSGGHLFGNFTNKRDREHTLQLKQTALRKTRIMQAGLSIALLMQSIGFLFIPLIFAWQFNAIFFHTFTNIGLVIFISLMIAINTPMQQVQRMFRRDSQVSMESSTAHNSSRNVESNDPPTSPMTIIKDLTEDEKSIQDPATFQNHHHHGMQHHHLSTSNALSSSESEMNPISEMMMKDVQSPGMDSLVLNTPTSIQHQEV
ncbi:hypothetical protein C9374_013553 [Naegleria lovaniensis]|uniref:Uncharacterized protein n=1 Tax=Naegleria lovaniensis TaxID=51637 RepID=A0AA88GZJ3_NAELO|nr:uncharacterized protein C9374_013553 [Naegleria lovaniensis]KAG2392068.1 hypothetical protein C9374_013553 [Naegleria lovaniensis]